jgi:hypothetical protein
VIPVVPGRYLALVGDEESVGAKVLQELRASYSGIKDRTLELLAGYRKD